MNLLFLNSIGTMEMVVILFAILMLFGSKGLPGFARNIGKGMREIRDASNEIKRDIQNSALEMRKDMNAEDIVGKLMDEDEKKPEIKNKESENKEIEDQNSANA